METAYPTVDLDFLVSLLNGNPKIMGTITQGKSTGYVIRGTKPLGERIVIIREVSEGQVDFDFATGIAIKLKCMPELVEWLNVNRAWNDGAGAIA